MQLQVIDKLRPMNEVEQSYYGDDDIPILSQEQQIADEIDREHAYFNTNYGQPSHHHATVVNHRICYTM